MRPLEATVCEANVVAVSVHRVDVILRRIMAEVLHTFGRRRSRPFEWA